MFEVKGITPQADPHADESKGAHDRSHNTHSLRTSQAHA
jgi:hypothetical protein